MTNILQFPKSVIVRERGRNRRFPRQSCFQLGTLTTYSGRSVTEVDYWLHRAHGGQFWRLLWSYDREPRRLINMITFTPEDVISNVASIGFHIPLDQWLAMGWRPSRRPQSATLIYVNPSGLVRKTRSARVAKSKVAVSTGDLEVQRGPV